MRVSPSGSTWLKALRSKKEDDDHKIGTEYAYKYVPQLFFECFGFWWELWILIIRYGTQSLKLRNRNTVWNSMLSLFLLASLMQSAIGSSSGQYTSDAYNI